MAAINSIATALPSLDFEQDFRIWARQHLGEGRDRKLYERMIARSGIEHRWSILSEEDARLHEGRGLYGGDAPGTAERMRLYGEHAPELALQAIAGLGELGDVTHLVVASCTGFVAPGIDQILARRLGLRGDVERVLIGYMGCYAAATALRTARHIVRSEPEARVLVVTVELSSLHHRAHESLEALLAASQFGDGAAAALVTGDGEGLELGAGLSVALEETDELIRWDIGDIGFEMHLSGEVPGKIAAALREDDLRSTILGNHKPGEIDAWAVHAGGRSILDAVESGLGLASDALDASRDVLRECGNMSSSTLMFALEKLFPQRPDTGVALAFGPGLAMEGFRFGWRHA